MKPTRSRFRQLAALFLAMFAVGMLAAWLVGRPKQQADHFAGLVSQGDFEGADAMLAGQSSLREDSAGNLIVTNNKGTATTISKDELPLRGVEPFYFQPRRSNFDYVAGRYHFPLASSGPAVQAEQQEPRVVSAISTMGGIVIDSVSQ